MGVLGVVPGRNQRYAHFLFGLGVGLLLGGLWGKDSSPTYVVILGAIFIIPSIIISYFFAKDK